MPHRYCRRSILLLLVSASLLLPVSCQSGPDDATAPEGQGTITFSVTNYRQVSFDDLSRAGTSRAGTIAMTLANLSFTVFDAETDEQVSSMLHRSSDYDSDPSAAKSFPQFSVTLPYGRYKVLVLGYNGSRACNVASLNHVSWEGNYVPNTFLYYDEFTLDENTSLSTDVTLRRVVAAFRVTAEDAIPAQLRKVRFVNTAGGTVLDATTGFASTNSGRTSEIVVPSDSIGKQGVSFTTYLFLPTEETSGHCTVQALDGDETAFAVKQFNDVPLRINYLTEWNGSLFSASGNDGSDDVERAFYIEWDTEWEGTISYNP